MPGWKHAFSLPWAAVKAATPPGTVVLIEHGVTYRRGRYVNEVVKCPRPTEDPTDPLNWPGWFKVACMTTVAFYAFAANYISTAVAPALPIWNLQFPEEPRAMKDLMGFISFNVLVLGLGNIFWVPLSNIFGRRPVLVLSTLLLAVSTGLGMHLKGFKTTLILRILQGLGSSASETVVPAVVGDLFFVHERGKWMAFYTAFLASGSVLGGITGGYIAARMGWAKLFWIGAGLAGYALFSMLFSVPETLFERGGFMLPIQRNLPDPDEYRPRYRPSAQFSSRINQLKNRASTCQSLLADSRPLSSPAPAISLGTLPSARLTIPPDFQYHGPLDPPMTWYDPSSSSEELPTAAEPPARQTDGLTASSFRTAKYDNRFSCTTSTEEAPTSNWPSTRNSFAPIMTPAVRDKRAQPLAAPPEQQGEGWPLRSLPVRHKQTVLAFIKSLNWLGTYRGNWVHYLLKPWRTLRLPATWVVMLQYGGLVGSVAVISTVGPQILSLPPYSWGENTGLLFVGSLVGILLGAGCAALLVDWRLKRLAWNQDRGYAEPETRLAVMAPALVIGTSGLLVFGFCAQYPTKLGWLGLEFGNGMVAFALSQVPSIWFNYLIDAYDQLASDCFTIICVLRGLIPFAWTFFVTQWVERQGFLIPFGGFTAAMGLFSLLILPIIHLGKRMRIAMARYIVDNQ